MNQSIIISFIGDDRPGVVEQLARTVRQYNGNWLESRLAQMAGKFAGIVRVTAPTDKIDELKTALAALKAQGLTAFVENTHADNTPPKTVRVLNVGILGSDRPGIIMEVSQALAQRGINVRELKSDVTSAPMSGEPLFEANAIIEVPTPADTTELKQTLDKIADVLCIDIWLEET